jgi:hypothetical protein
MSEWLKRFVRCRQVQGSIGEKSDDSCIAASIDADQGG